MKKLVFVLSLALLLTGALKVSAQTAGPMLPAASAFTTSLDVGAQGSGVTALQQFLIAKGYLQVAVPTGFYGNMTAQAVSSFQAANNLPQVGRVGPKTLALLQQLLNGGSSQMSVGVGGGMSMNVPPPQQPSNGCSTGDLFNPTTGALCSQQSTSIAGCTGSNLYSALTGQLCGAPQTPHQYDQPQQQQNDDTVITSPSSDPVSAGNTTATLTGQWPGDTAGASAVGWFNYGTSAADLNQATQQTALASFANNQGIFSASISNLQPNTTYYYEVEVSIQPDGMGDDVNGLVVSFTTTNSGTVVTQSATASVVTDPALDPTSGIMNSNALLTGQLLNDVWSEAQNTTDQVWFNYGTSPTLAGASQTPYVGAFQGVNYQGLFTSSGANLNLQPNTTYYYQACADSTTGTPAQACGSIASFTTTNSGTVQTQSATIIADPSNNPTPPPPILNAGYAWLTGQVLGSSWQPNGSTQPVVTSFTYGTSPTLAGATSTTYAPYSVMTGGYFSQVVTGLTSGGSYYYQACAEVSAGTTPTCSSIVPFTSH